MNQYKITSGSNCTIQLASATNTDEHSVGCNLKSPQLVIKKDRTNTTRVLAVRNKVIHVPKKRHVTVKSISQTNTTNSTILALYDTDNFEDPYFNTQILTCQVRTVLKLPRPHLNKSLTFRVFNFYLIAFKILTSEVGFSRAKES